MSLYPDFTPRTRRLGFLLLSMASLLMPEAFAADKPSAAPAEPKTHIVFVGLDLSVALEGKNRRIVGITKSHAELEVGAGVKRLRAESLKGFTLQRAPKVSRESVDLGEIKAEPAFRSGGVVDQAWAEAKESQWLGETIMDIAEGRADIRDQSPRVQAALRDLEDMGGGGRLQMRELGKKSIERGELDHADLEAEARRWDLYDALDVSFVASAPQPVTDCYAAVVCTVRSSGGGSVPRVGNLVFFCELGVVDPVPKRLKTQFTGFPVGFRLLRAEFHVYSRARELASNVAPNQMLLTERQAHQFMVLQYIAAHKTETLLARIAFAPTAGESLAVPSQREMHLPVHLAVDAAGMVSNISAPGASQALQDYMSGLRFYPAIESGTAVASKVTLSLGDLPQ